MLTRERIFVVVDWWRMDDDKNVKEKYLKKSFSFLCTFF